MTPGDPAVFNAWGTNLNNGMIALVDSAIAGVLTVNVTALAGYPNAVPTSTSGAADQARNAHFKLTGVLTGTTLVLFPAGLNRNFTLNNATTGAFTLSVGANNGSGGAAGTTITVPQGQSVMLLSDGTNVTSRVNAFVGGLAADTLIVGAPLAPLTSRVRNGDFRICQRATSQAAAANGFNTCDGWIFSVAVTTAVLTQSQSLDHPLFGSTGAAYSLSHVVTTADAVVTAAKVVGVTQDIEGFYVADLLGQGASNPNITAAFWVKSPKSGIHCIALRSAGLDRSFIMEYTVTSANTWERKVITFAIGNALGAGTWNLTNGIGLQVVWSLMAGATYQTTAGAWQNGNFLATNNQQNLVDTNGNTFKVSDVLLVQGNNAPAMEYLPLDRSLSFQQRYFQKTFAQGTAPAQNVGVNTGELTIQVINTSTSLTSVPLRFPVVMRATPTAVFFNPAAANSNPRDISLGADCALAVPASVLSDSGGRMQFNGNASTGQGNLIGVHYTMSAEI